MAKKIVYKRGARAVVSPIKKRASEDINPVVDMDSAATDVYTMGSAAMGITVLAIIIILVLNITGTVYYTKLKNTRASKDRIAGGLASVIIGWLFCPLVNIASPIMYAADK